MATPPRANLSREEPDAGNLHVRVCEGWGRQRPHLLGIVSGGPREMAQEQADGRRYGEAAEEGQPAGVVECDQPDEEHAAEQLEPRSRCPLVTGVMGDRRTPADPAHVA